MTRKILFLIRPPAADGEGIAEYLQRLAKANGFRDAFSVCSLLKVPLNDIVVAGHSKLQAVIHGQEDAGSLRYLGRNHPAITPYRDQLGVSKNARVCISCLRESDFINHAWSEPLAISCDKHGERLLDHCPRCFRQILRTGSQYRCHCGLSFVELEPQSSPDWESKFNELFTPWRSMAPDVQQSACISRLELQTARYFRKIVNYAVVEGAPQKNARCKNRVYSCDYDFLDTVFAMDFDFKFFFEKTTSASRRYLTQWRKLSKLCDIPKPMIVLLIEHEIKQMAYENFQKAIKHSQNRALKADSIENLIRILGCDARTATKMLRNDNWRFSIENANGDVSTSSFLDTVRSVVNRTYSIAEVFDLIGIPIKWKGHFYRSTHLAIKIIPDCFRAWRVPKLLIEDLLLQFNKCRELARPVSASTEGFIRISEIPSTSIQLQIWIQNQLRDGVLNLAFEDSSPKSTLVDFSIPLKELLSATLSRRVQLLASRLARYPEKTDEWSRRRTMHAIPA